MLRSVLVRGSTALLALTATMTQLRPADAAFSDFLVQPPRLATPERGSVAGDLSGLGFEPGHLARGGFSLPMPIALPTGRGAPLVGLVPSYAADNGQSEWGMGWRLDLSIRRSALVGDIDPAGNEFVSPWGRLVQRSDGSYAPTGAAPTVSLRRVNGGWEAVTGDGSRFTFAASDAVANGYAWMLSRVDGLLGDSTVFTYARNASGRPFLSAVEWGGRGEDHQYRLELAYETLAISVEDYRAGVLLTLDRRVQLATVRVRSAAGAFETGWTYTLDYTASPRGAAHYLTGITRRNRAGAAEPTHRYTYDFGDTTLATATLVDVPALGPVLAAAGGTALQPDKAAGLDREDDGLLEFELARDQSLVRRQGSAFTIEPLASAPGANVLCRPSPSSSNTPRTLARMSADAAEPQVFRAIKNGLSGTSRVLVCDRQGVPALDAQLSGAWELNPTTRLVDLNNDHRPDLIRLFSRGYQIVENTSDDTGLQFVVHPNRSLTDSFTPSSTWVQDMNGDGQSDLVMRFPTAIGVWYGLGQFRFTPAVRLLPFKTTSGTTIVDIAERELTFVDVNRDGLMDVLTTRGRVLNLFINNGRQLNEAALPGLTALPWDFGVPVVADITGGGNVEVMLVQGTQAKAIDLSAPSTGLLTSADDGKGTIARFGYARSTPAPGIRQRTTVLDSLTIESSGYDTVSYGYSYGAPVLHSLGKHLVGFASVDKQSPLVTEHLEFLNDDDVAGVRALSETTDERTPGIVRFSREHYQDVTLDAVRWLRPTQSEAGYRNSDGSVTLTTTTQYNTYERGFCPTVITTQSPGGQLMSASTLTSVPAIPDELHCASAKQRLFGSHTDAALDFHYAVDLEHNELGQVTRVTQLAQLAPLMQPLVLQEVAYNADHRVSTIGAPGRGTTIAQYDGFGRLVSLTDPVGVVTEVDDIDPVSDSVLALATLRPGAPLTTFFRYDGRDRLASSWDDLSGGTEAVPLTAYTYQDATRTAPGRIDSQALADVTGNLTRRMVELLAADGEPLVAGTWLGDHVAFEHASIANRNTLTQRTSFVGVLSEAALAAMTSDDLRSLGTPLVETVTAGFGHAAQTTTTHQQAVIGVETSEMLLGSTEVVSRVHQPGGFVAETATDAAGRLVRKTDEAGVTHRYTYDALGRLVRAETPDGAQTLVFDGLGRPSRVARAGLGAVTYGYDPVSGLQVRKRHLDAGGAVVDTSDTTYDAIGRAAAVVQYTNHKLSGIAFDYDGELGAGLAPGQLGRLSHVGGAGWDRSTLFDPAGRPYQQRIELAGWRDLTSDTSYRADGSVASNTLTIADAAGAVQLSVTKQTELDSLGRLSALRVDGAVIYTLTYDAEDRLARADFSSGESIVFHHDPVTHHLTGYTVEAPSASGGVQWELDTRGLVAAETFAHDATTHRRTYGYDGRAMLTGTTTGAGVASYSYTASGLPDHITDQVGTRSVRPIGGQLTVDGVTYTWDAAGRVASKGVWTFEYGPDGQLAHARKPGRQVDFLYDENDERLLKLVDGVPVRARVAGGVLTEEHFVELVTVGGVVAGVLDNGQFTALLTDPRGTPFADADGNFNLASPYGVRGAHLGISEVIDYTRLGWDPDLDVVRMGVRDYDAKLSQFLTPDPLYFEDLEKCQSSPLQCSLYGYAIGNPVSFVDPTGTSAKIIPFPKQPVRPPPPPPVGAVRTTWPAVIWDLFWSSSRGARVAAGLRTAASVLTPAAGVVAALTPSTALAPGCGLWGCSVWDEHGPKQQVNIHEDVAIAAIQTGDLKLSNDVVGYLLNKDVIMTTTAHAGLFEYYQKKANDSERARADEFLKRVKLFSYEAFEITGRPMTLDEVRMGAAAKESKARRGSPAGPSPAPAVQPSPSSGQNRITPDLWIREPIPSGPRG